MIKITAETTDEQILATIKSAQATLLEDVTEAMGSEYQMGDRLVQMAQNVMSAEAVASVALQYRDVLKGDYSDEARLKFLLSHLTQGPDDTWSGRKNDSKRSANDAVRAFVSEQFDNIRYGN